MMKRQRGFTLVELMVTMAVGAVLVVAAVGMYLTVLGQSPIVKTRNTLSTNLQNALNRINDDVRRSSNVTLYNLTADPNAPNAKTGYENVPGPTTDTDDKYYWRMGESRLLLNQTPVTAAGAPIYDNAQYAAGKKNTIVYYVRDGALYRRVIAADYGTNSVATATCATRSLTGGCIESDTKLVDNLKASLGTGAFKVVYYDRNGNPISYTAKDSAGNDIPDYGGFPLTRAIGVTIALESGTIVGNQTVSLSNSMRMQFRSQLNVAPVDTTEPYVPPTNGIGDPGLMVGPGGLYLSSGSTVQGGDVYVKGKVTLDFNTRIGGNPVLNFNSTGTPVNLNVANIGCGSGATYPSPCEASSPPITIHASFASINGKVCAKDQPSPTANINPFGSGQGLISSCTPPEVDLPAFDKASFVSQMTNGTALGSTGSCSNGNQSTAANRTYTGNVSWTTFCTVSVTGSMYITGGLTASNARIRVAESAGKVRPIIVVNGRIELNGTVYPNSYGTTPYFVSFFSSDSTCSNSNSCTTITPAKLKETLDNYTGHQISGGNAPVSLRNITAPGSSFYSYFGETYVDFFAKVGAVGGQRVKMSNADISLDAKL